MDEATLNELAAAYGEQRFVFAGVGQPGRVLDLNGHTAEVFGNLRLKRLDAPHIAADGTVCHFGSDELGLRWLMGEMAEREWYLLPAVYSKTGEHVQWRVYF